MSPSMRNGDNMREVMTHQAPLVSALRPPTDPTRGRAWRLSQSMSADSLRRADSADNDCDSDIGSTSNFRGRLSNSLSANNLAWTASPRHSENGEALSPKSRTGASEVSRASSLGRASSYDPRAKPGSIASEMTSATGRRSPRSAQDHLWRELFHQEADERKVAKLRGAGKAIGSRGKASTGIPWRQIPAYDSGGRLCETGDPYSDRKAIVKASGMGERKRAQFSPRLEASAGVHELLAPVSENCENRPPPVQHPNSEAREAWLDAVKRRADAKYNQVSSRPLKQKQQAPSDVSDDTRSLHQEWRHLRRPVSNAAVNAVHSGGSTEDSCPFQRDDSSGRGSKSMQSTRRVRRGSPTPLRNTEIAASSDAGDPLSRTSPGCGMLHAEKVEEARRDWQFTQDKGSRDDCMLGDASPASGLNNSTSSRSFLAKSASVRSFSSTTASSVMNPVHSIRPRPEGGHRPRWK